MKVWAIVFIIFFGGIRLEAAEISVGTFNLAMLDIGNPVPFLNERQQALSKEVDTVLRKSKIDVLAFQEMWTENSINILSKVHPDYELLSVGGDAWIPFLLDRPTGLGFLVKKSLRAAVNFKDFNLVEGSVCGFGQICDKGILELTFNFQGKKFAVLNTHLTSGVDGFVRRKAELAELIDHKNHLLKNKRKDVVLLVGDFNFSPTFGTIKQGDQGDDGGWKKNSTLYKLLVGMNVPAIKTNCRDAYADSMLKPDFDYTYNRETNRVTLGSPSFYVEPSQRVDHIFVCEDFPKSAVVSTQLAFNQPFGVDTFPEGMHLSDHYAVFSTLRLP